MGGTPESYPCGKLDPGSEERLCLLRGEAGIHPGRRKNSQSECSRYDGLSFLLRLRRQYRITFSV